MTEPSGDGRRGHRDTMPRMDARRETEDDWDRIDRLTWRFARWALVFVIVWFIALDLLQEDITGIPLEFGFIIATALAVAIAVVDDRRRSRKASGTSMSALGRVVLLWVAVYLALSLTVGVLGGSLVAVGIIPIFGATLVAALVEFGRRLAEQSTQDR